jgi:hypothetical protein
MNLSRRQLTYIGVAVVILLIIIGILIWRRGRMSKYSAYDLSVSTAQTPAQIYSNLSTCTNAFVTASTPGLIINQNISCTGGQVTVTVGPAYPLLNSSTLATFGWAGLAQGSLVNVQGVSSDGTTGPVYGYKGYNMPITGITNTSFTYNSPTNGCAGVVKNPGFSWLSTSTAVNLANVTRMSCISSNIALYQNVSCKYSTIQSTGLLYAPLTASGDSTSVITTYNNFIGYQNNISNAYQTILTNPGSLNTLLTGTAAAGMAPYVANLARKADLTAATRNYFQAACSGFYKTSFDPGAAVVTSTSTGSPGYTIPTSPYSSYSQFTPGNTIPPGVPTSGSYFVSNLITANTIYSWWTYSGGGMSGSQSVPAGPKAPQFGPSGILNNGNFVQTTYANVVADIGPGTVTMLGPLPLTNVPQSAAAQAAAYVSNGWPYGYSSTMGALLMP